MNFEFYNVKDDKNVINKTLGASVVKPVNGSTAVSGDISDGCSIITPVFIVDTTFTKYPNYVYCDELARYYFVNDIKVGMGGRRKFLYCTVDPLMSFKDDILKLNVYVERNEFQCNNMLADNQMPLESEAQIEMKTTEFPYVSNKAYYVIGVI